MLGRRWGLSDGSDAAAADAGIKSSARTASSASGLGATAMGTAAFGLASVLAAGSADAQTAEPGTDLPSIEVTGESGASGYRATSSGVGRIATPLRDTPQTVNVVPQQLIQERRATTLEEALRNVSGITFSAGEGGQQGDNPIIHGFSARGDIYRDGVRDPGWYTRDLFSIDSVEVFKGPSSFAFGRGSTGAAINNNSKLPLSVPKFVDAQITGMTGPGARVDFDAGAKVESVAGRLVLMAQDFDTPDRDSVYAKRWGFAPSLSIDASDKTKITLSYIYQGENSTPDYGVPWLVAPAVNATGTAVTGGSYGNGLAVKPVPVPRNSFYGTTSGLYQDVVKTSTNIATIRVEHQLNDQIKITNTSRYLANDRFSQPTPPRTLGTATGVALTAANAAAYPLALTTIGREHWNLITDDTLAINQTDVTAKFDTWGLQHSMVAGFEISKQTRQQRGRTYISYPASAATNIAGVPVSRTNLYDISAYQPGQIVTYGNPNQTHIGTVAGYVSDQIKIGPLFEILAAGRYDDFDARYQDPLNATPANRYLSAANKFWDYRVGGVYHPIQTASLYVAYGTSVNPSAEFGTLTNGTVALAPETNTNLEAGGKIDVLDGKLSLTAGYFHTEKQNARVTGPDTTTLPTILGGQQLVQGVEAGVVGKLTEKLQVYANYTYQESKIQSVGPYGTAADLYTIGKQLPNTPPHTFNLWATYDILPNFQVGGGATYVSKDYANTSNTLYVPEYWKFDAMASYKFNDATTLQVNVYNIGNAYYYAQYYAGHAVPASGRWAQATLRVRF